MEYLGPVTPDYSDRNPELEIFSKIELNVVHKIGYQTYWNPILNLNVSLHLFIEIEVNDILEEPLK